MLEAGRPPGGWSLAKSVATWKDLAGIAHGEWGRQAGRQRLPLGSATTTFQSLPPRAAVP